MQSGNSELAKMKVQFEAGGNEEDRQEVDISIATQCTNTDHTTQPGNRQKEEKIQQV